ncbi:MAG: MFS transporter [Anaerolineales bacterium]|nr:MFS transporter [Anaerolineales bacterium]
MTSTSPTVSNSTPQTHPKRVIYSLFIANAISMTGNQLALLAIPWFVLATTGSAAQTGITAFFTLLPTVLATFLGGAFIDRIGFKPASIIADLASGVTVLLIPVLFVAGWLPFWLLQVLVFLGALLDAPGVTARDALLPELAAAAEMPLERIASLNQIVERSSRLLGAPAAGFLIALVSAQNVLYLDAATFAVSALLVWFIVPNIKIDRPADETGSSPGYLTDLQAGLRYVRQDSLILTIVGVVLITNFLDAALSSVIYPVFVREVYGSAIGLGLIFGVSGGGAVIGALVYSAVGHRYSASKVYIWSFIVVALARIPLIFLPPLWIVLTTAAIVGLAAGALNPIMSAVSYSRIPSAMRARVLGVIRSGAFMAMPLGVLLAGYALDGLGLRQTLIIVLACYLLTTVSLLFNRQLRAMDADKV